MGEVSKFADSRSYFADIVTKKKGVVYGFSNAQQQLEKGGWNIKTDGRKQDDTSKWDLGLDDDFVGEKKAMASIERS